jgi:hypothetical protein
MRRSLGAAAVIALIFALATTAVGAVYIGYRDGFSGVSYWGSEGTIEWFDPWKEVGENNGPGGGAVFVDTNANCASGRCLHIFSGGEYIANLGAYRVANTSVFSSSNLSFDLKRRYLSGTGAQIYVQVSTNGGATWAKTLLSKPFDASDSGPVRYNFDVSPWASTQTAVRFVLFTPEGQSISGSVFVDNVWISGDIVGPTTTTSSTITIPEITTTTEGTSTTEPKATTTSSTTTTTTPGATTSSSTPGDTATSSTTLPGDDPSTTTTTISDTTSTTAAFILLDNGEPPAGPPGPPEGSGIRETPTGIQADFDSALFGDVEGGTISISSVDHQVDFRMAFELIKSSWVWLVVLALVVAWSIVSGLDRRRSVAGA